MIAFLARLGSLASKQEESRMPEYFTAPTGRRIAYQQSAGKGPGIVFLGGFMSDMAGTKAVALEAWAQAQGRAFLRFDYSGHGESDGAFDAGVIGDWARDARDIIEALTEGPQILVGSSMGGWISLILAAQIPEKIAGLVSPLRLTLPRMGFGPRLMRISAMSWQAKGALWSPQIMTIHIRSRSA
jgi:pimeloyl-ACP methyl ester carboxylesterase